MTELSSLIAQQKKDLSQYRIYSREENETLIRPHKYRFYDFAGETLKQKAFCVLRYFGWLDKEVIDALKLTFDELLDMTTILDSTYNKKNYTRFYKKIPASSPRDKAIIILKGLKWKDKEVANVFNISRKHVYRISTIIRLNRSSF